MQSESIDLPIFPIVYQLKAESENVFLGKLVSKVDAKYATEIAAYLTVFEYPFYCDKFGRFQRVQIEL